LSESGWEALKQRRPIHLVKPIATPKRGKAGDKQKIRFAADAEYDDALFDRLRRLRKTIADQMAVPAYIVFSDVSLRQMARHYPTTEREFGRISGVGEKKLADFGRPFMDSITEYLLSHARRIFN
jgi:ATP-dependent DNA helicase RecQ